MSTLVVYADTSDGYIRSMDSLAEGTDYPTARAGTDALDSGTTSASLTIGQRHPYEYWVYEAFLSFDTSGIGSGSTVTNATLRVTCLTDFSTTDFIIEARSDDWGSSLTTADWVAGASLSGKTLLAHYDTSSSFSAGTAYDLMDDAFPANVDKTGSTRVMLASSRTRIGTAPSGNESVTVYSADQSGTTSDPKLTVTYEAGSAAGGTPLWRRLLMGRRRVLVP